MASYGIIYEFLFDSVNAAEIRIAIAQKGYSGVVNKRRLGRAPVLKRENNGAVFGTSLEIYAECKIDGEFSHLYTSSAREFIVYLYKDGTLIWTGFVSPELYSEPDIAPPYDVQIIATDGLGELRNYEFVAAGKKSIREHLNTMLSYTGLSLENDYVSRLKYVVTTDSSSSSGDALDVVIDLDHEKGDSYYNALQRLLTSLNASITQHNGRWMVFRETDFIRLASENGLQAYDSAGELRTLEVDTFGSAKTSDWWPVGQLSTVIEPAKKKIILESPNHYKDNVLNPDGWSTAGDASHSETDSVYILPSAGAAISQKLDFGGVEVGYRLALSIVARNVGSGVVDQNLGVKVKIEGHVAGGYYDYWMSPGETAGAYSWITSEASLSLDLAVPGYADTDSDAQTLNLMIPLYDNRKPGVSTSSWIYAKSVEVTIFNPDGTHDIHIYDISLIKYDQFNGYQSDVLIGNGAREEASTVDLSMTAGDTAAAAGDMFMTGIPLSADGSIVSLWTVGSDASQGYLTTMSRDYSREIALPRMKYSGVLNVPSGLIPALFLRDATYYFPRTYSYDLRNDELSVELISISAADVVIESQTVKPMAAAASSGTAGAGSGSTGGIGGGTGTPPDQAMSDTSENAVQNKVIKAYIDELADLLASMWKLEGENLVTTRQVVIKNNLIIEGDTSSGGSGESTEATGTVTGIAVNGQTYTPTAGIVTIPDYPTSLEWTAIANKPTFATVATSGKYSDLSGVPTIPTKLSELTDDVVAGKYQPLSTAINTGNIGSQSVNYATTAGSAPNPTALTIKAGSASVTYNGSEAKSIEITKALLGLGNVENTALSSWTGSAKITTLGTITSGTWNGSKIANAYLANSAITIAGTSVSLGGSITAATITTALIGSGNSFVHSGNIGSQSVKYATSAGSAPASDVYAWAKAASKPSYTTTEVSEGTNLYFTDARAVSALSGTLAGYLPLTGGALTGALTSSSTILASSVICGTGRLRVNAADNAANFGYMKAETYNSNRGVLRIGTNYGGSATITNAGVDVDAINIYRGVVGIGGTIASDTLYSNQSAGVVLHAAGNTLITGNLSVSASYTADGTAGIAGVVLRNEGGIELVHASTPYIDFHHSLSTEDFSIRLISPSAGNLGITGNFIPQSTNGYSLGASAKIWYKVWANHGSFSGALSVGSGATITGDVTINGNLIVTGDTSSGGSAGTTVSEIATASAVGGLKPAYNTTGTATLTTATASFTDSPTIAARTTTAGRYYAVEMDSAGRAYVNVPWVNTNPLSISNTYYATLMLSGQYSNVQLILGGIPQHASSYPYTTYKLYVYGSARATGTFSSASDINLKNVQNDVPISVADIALAPAFEFTWKDREEEGIWLGTSAQYWKEVLPNAVRGIEGDYSLSYGELALCSAIVVAREVKTHGEKITALEAEINALKERLAIYE